MRLWEQYYQPSSVSDALEILDRARGSARLIAGGTDLLLDIRQGRHPPVEAIIDITGIEEMRTIEEIDGQLYLGAAVTHARILAHEDIRQRAVCLHEACALIGGPQVRNVATIGGNVAHALPAADGTIALLALETEAELASPGGRRWEPLEALFAGPGQPAFDRTRELITRFRFQLSDPGQVSTFRRVMRPQGVAIAILNMAGWMQLDEDGRIAQIRIAAGPGGPVPFRARETERALRGQRPDDPAALAEAVDMLLGEIRLRTSRHRATLTYRQHLAGVLLGEIMQSMLQKWERPR